MEQKLNLKKIDILSFTKTLAIIYAVFGLFLGVFMTLAFLATGLLSSKDGGLGIVFGLGGALFIPIFYGITGAFTGLVLAFAFNIVSGWTGGIEVEVDID